MKRTLLLALLLVISGCTSTYTKMTLSQPSTVLQRGKTVAIATPDDGFYETKQYRGSGQSTAQAARAAFAKFAAQTSVLPECKVLACLKETSAVGSDYLVVPEILHWEDRNTEWSGIKDKLEIKLSVYDAKTGKELAATVLAGKSKWMTFGGDHPQDLLQEPIDAYVATLF